MFVPLHCVPVPLSVHCPPSAASVLGGSSQLSTACVHTSLPMLTPAWLRDNSAAAATAERVRGALQPPALTSAYRRVPALTGGVPTTYRRRTDGVTTAYRRRTDRVPAAYRRRTDRVPAAYRRRTDRVPAAYRPRTDGVPTAYRRRTDRVPAAYRRRTGDNRAAAVTGIRDGAQVSEATPRGAGAA